MSCFKFTWNPAGVPSEGIARQMVAVWLPYCVVVPFLFGRLPTKNGLPPKTRVPFFCWSLRNPSPLPKGERDLNLSAAATK